MGTVYTTGLQGLWTTLFRSAPCIAKGLAGTADDDLTSPNVMMGTAKYLSPEQVRGRKLDGRADLYSLGLVLYECLDRKSVV